MVARRKLYRRVAGLTKIPKPTGLTKTTTLRWCKTVQDGLLLPDKGKNVLLIPTAMIKDIEQDYAQRAVVGMLFGPRPPIDTLRAWIRHNWENIGLEVAQTQALRNNTYIFLFKEPEMALKAIAAGQWMLRNSPLCLFKWSPDFKPEGNNQVKYPVWVEFPDLPFQYYPLLNLLAEPPCL